MEEVEAETLRIPVSVIKCNSYEYPAIFESLENCLERIGGIRRFVKRRDIVALKVNLLCPATPDRAVTTHPAVVACVAKMVGEAGGEPIIVDSPGGGARYTTSSLRDLYGRTGMKEVAEKGLAKLNYDTSFVSVSFSEGKLVKRFDVIRPILDADVVINLPKFKTHEFTYLTAGVKNLYGAIPGKAKVTYHATLRDVQDFSDMLIDLFLCINPSLTIVDAVIGMDGDGPTSGRPRKLGLLLASENALAVDVLLAETVGMDPVTIPHVRAAVKRGLCSGGLEDIEILGERLESIRISDFTMPKSMVKKRKPRIMNSLCSVAAPLLKEMFSVKPKIIPELCIGCGICEGNCPEHAISLSNGKALIDQGKCIRCYCCFELCPHKSVELTKGPLYALGRAFS
jgi:uncharacterized protein (DUF362 family)/NAD-dependent dihydropyrimidine dehydrogenase PreA subunit